MNAWLLLEEKLSAKQTDEVLLVSSITEFRLMSFRVCTPHDWLAALARIDDPGITGMNEIFM